MTKATPDECAAHIESCVKTLGSPEGGLSLVWVAYPPTPYEVFEAIMRTVDRRTTMWV
jgi:hypothetical protein